MAQQTGALAAHTEDVGLVPSTHTISQPSVTPVSADLMLSCRHPPTHTHTQGKHIMLLRVFVIAMES